jgi:hypothetical protein
VKHCETTLKKITTFRSSGTVVETLHSLPIVQSGARGAGSTSDIPQNGSKTLLSYPKILLG